MHNNWSRRNVNECGVVPVRRVSYQRIDNRKSDSIGVNADE